MRTLEGLAILVALCAMGCGGGTAGGEDAAAAPDAAMSTATDTGGGGGGPDAGPRDDAGPGMPGTAVPLRPMIVTHGTNALAWTLPDSGCDMVVINRNRDGGAYAEVSRLTGTATDAEDFSGHGSGTFCYTVSCVIGDVTGDPSNERCVTQ